MQLSEGRVESVNPSERLMPILVRIRETVEDHGIGRDAVPTFSPCLILHEIQPAIGVRHFFMSVTVPLGAHDLTALAQTPQHL